MFPFDSHIKNLLMISPFSPRLLQSFHFVILEFPSNRCLKFLAADLLQSLALLGRFQPWLEARLHPDTHGGIK